ncbi:hypothetical protein LO771_28915 [Streptacidiphilus sp. ASG 303]|uniref:hypothetical protein n=1 Tax=Streptacidiphilus sp. ASG 303 TaxID=2896847 RepID=UPI001E4C45A8|nr:hypothetical protein [Streptacidiphilus sp. ASG 303]MCD0486294.1 hypothetical protein [Streptacidiphilus sp. ASG 303]
MSQEYSSINGLLGIGADAEGRDFYLRVAAGSLAYDRGEGDVKYIQVYLFQPASPGHPADVNDMFETDDLDELAADISRGMLDWYGNRLDFRTPTPEERDIIRAATGWE